MSAASFYKLLVKLLRMKQTSNSSRTSMMMTTGLLIMITTRTFVSAGELFSGGKEDGGGGGGRGGGGGGEGGGGGIGERGRCRIKCGVVVEERGTETLLQFMSSVWDEIRRSRSINDVEILFEPTERKEDMTMDTLIEAYMEIGTMNVSAIFGPYIQPVITATVKFGIPYFLTDSPPRRDSFRPYNLLSVRPSDADLAAVTVDIVRRYSWTRLAVLYDGPHGAQLIETLVRTPSLQVRAWTVSETMTSDELRAVMLDIRHVNIRDIILASFSQALTSAILDAALAVSMLSGQHSWILSTLSDSDPTLNSYVHTGVNMTSLRLVLPRKPTGDLARSLFTPVEYTTVYDSLLAVYHGVRIQRRDTGSCHWAGKSSLITTLVKIRDADGATGQVSFRPDGSRYGYSVNVRALDSTGTISIGTWNSSLLHDENKLVLVSPPTSTSTRHPTANVGDVRGTHDDVKSWTSLRQRTISVVVMEESPLVSLRADHSVRSGNSRYEGYNIDLLAELSASIGFNYTIELAQRIQYGMSVMVDSWTTIIAALNNGNASMVLSMPMTSSRERLVDFTVPVHSSGLSLSIRTGAIGRSAPPSHRLGRFVQPLSLVVWVLLPLTVLLVSATIYLAEWLSSSSLSSFFPCVGVGGTSRCFTVKDSVWFSVSAMLMLSSSPDSSPRSTAGRLAATGLRFFALFLILSYAGNLAAILTSARRQPHRPINVQDLIRGALSDVICFSTTPNSDVSALLETSTDPTIHLVWQKILSSKSFVDTPDEGMTEARRSSQVLQAYVWDSTSLQHDVMSDCTMDTVQLTEPNIRQFSIALPQGVGYRDELNAAVLELYERGIIGALQNKWWNGERHCDIPHEDSGLGLSDLADVFTVFIIIIITSLMTSAITGFKRKRNLNGSAPRHISLKQFKSVENCNKSSPLPSPERHLCNSEPIPSQTIKNHPLTAEPVPAPRTHLYNSEQTPKTPDRESNYNTEPPIHSHLICTQDNTGEHYNMEPSPPITYMQKYSVEPTQPSHLVHRNNTEPTTIPLPHYNTADLTQSSTYIQKYGTIPNTATTSTQKYNTIPTHFLPYNTEPTHLQHYTTEPSHFSHSKSESPQSMYGVPQQQVATEPLISNSNKRSHTNTPTTTHRQTHIF